MSILLERVVKCAMKPATTSTQIMSLSFALMPLQVHMPGGGSGVALVQTSSSTLYLRYLHALSIRTLRLRLDFDISRSAVASRIIRDQELRQLENLEMLEVAIFTQTRNASIKTWTTSFLVNGLVKAICEAVPTHIELRWGPWPALEEDEASSAFSRQGFGQGLNPIPKQALWDVASDYENFRGRKSYLSLAE